MQYSSLCPTFMPPFSTDYTIIMYSFNIQVPYWHNDVFDGVNSRGGVLKFLPIF